MFVRSFVAITALGVLATSAGAQTFQRRAVMNGRGDPNRGKCTIEVVVDGVADIEIRGDNGNIRNLSGRPAQWRRFECNGPLPSNPADFRFRGIDGRGSQELIRDPRNGGVAVVRIEDRDGGEEGYTFDLEWGGGSFQDNRGGGYGDGRGGGYGDGRGGGFPNGRGGDRRDRDRRFSTEDAVRACQQTVTQQAAQQYGARDLQFRRTMLDDNPGRRDSVLGTFSVRRGNDREQIFRFTCSVNFDNGQIRSAQIDPVRR
jgi:hypothetical protein